MTHRLRAAATIALVAFAAAAHADVKLVQSTIIENAPDIPGAPAAAKPPKAGEAAPQSTTFIKGLLQRVEDGTDVVRITDNAKGTVTTLNLKKKTYSVQKLDALAAMASPFTQFLDITVDGGIKPGEGKKQLAGREAQAYTTALKIAMSVKPGSPLPLPTGEGPLIEIAIDGEAWTVEGLAVDAKAREEMVAGMARGFSRVLPATGNLKEKMSGMKGFPLSSTTKISFKSSLPLPGIPKKPMTIRTEVVSLSEDPLADTLFQVPAGFKEVEAETPQIPGLGGGR